MFYNLKKLISNISKFSRNKNFMHDELIDLTIRHQSPFSEELQARIRIFSNFWIFEISKF